MKFPWPTGADEIRVDVHPDRFTFRTPRQTIELETAVFPGPVDRGDPVLRGVQLADRPVRLFDTPGPETAHVARAPMLAVFLRRALVLCMEDRVLKLRPHLVFVGAGRLDRLLSGYQYEVLVRAAVDAGARSVRFEAEPGTKLPPEYARRIPQEQAGRSLLSPRTVS